MTQRKRITFFLDALHGGGAEKAVVNLLKGLAQRNEFDLDLVLATKEGPYLDLVPPEVRIVDLNMGRAVKATLPLMSYLKKNRPWALIGNMGHVNVVALMAIKLSRIKTKLVLVEQNTVSGNQSKLKRAKLVELLMKWLYPHADAVAGVSAGVARDLEERLGLKNETVKVLNNPVVNEDLITHSQASLDHPWFAVNTPPVFLAVGRLNPQKDFLNLLNAFAQVRKQQEARLIILGEGEERPALEATIHNLGIGKDVLLPGFVKNPYVYMKHANCFVLSSRQEGLPTVLIEAMACGCPVVSTDCPSGPEEILDRGTYGLLVPIQNSAALGEAMLATLKNPPEQKLLMQRANEYSTEKVVKAYLSLLHEL
ncbi:glycosyl transferase [Pleurocapsa sp. CCALA 161]|uniref:glycosyltransferase n=1 Tax=Pleurocapsa sp. CCALA 161 TaxID=2107688 RepID=UPI000D056466|nr:glycosyltransferase [Pleurocapsa sp. CCALA 161]PSB09469.1 glycosyl transferase [Pleurocapsa sp. CCALA 161]